MKLLPFILYVLSVFLLLSFIAQAQDTLFLNQQWKFRQADDSSWYGASVPGTIHTDLLNNHLIPDPFYGNTETQLQWIEQKDFMYEKSFACTENFLSHKNIQLVFYGLDTYADIYLNNHLLFRANNMFRTWKYDVKPFLVTGSNTMRIYFHSAQKIEDSLAKQLSYELPGGSRVFTRKAAYEYGWDWGPRYVTCGIWRPVELIAWDNFLVENQFTKINRLDSNEANVSLILQVHADSNTSFHFTLNDEKKYYINDQIVDVKTGENEIELPFSIKDPELWWCNGLGKPFLYHVNAIIKNEKNDSITIPVQFGLRTIEVVQQRDSVGSSFYFKLNGIPVFIKGANYIPPDNFMSRISEKDYESILNDAAAVHMNMLRVWGGGVYEDDAFYKLCDEKGILIWEEFMFAGAMYPGDSAFMKNVKREAIDNIVRLRPHPCIALWCGNNEIDEAWHNWGWQDQYHYTSEQQDKIWNDYQKLFHQLLPDLLKEYDSSKFYWPSSPSYGWGHKESLEQGDSHYWGVWWGKEPFSMYREKVGRFMSEYGFQGMPAMNTIEKFSAPADLTLSRRLKNPMSTVLKAHQKHPVGFETIQAYMKRDYKVPKDFENYDYVSQLLQRDGMKTAIESHRTAKPYCMGTLYWQLNDCWPVTSWSSRDYFGNWKALHYNLSDLYNTYLMSISKKDEDRIEVRMVSDSLQEVEATLHLKLIDFSGKELWKFDTSLVIKKESSDPVRNLDEHNFPKSFHEKNCMLVGSLEIAGKTKAVADFYFLPPKKISLPKDKAIIDSFRSVSSADAQWQYVYSFSIHSNKLLKDIYMNIDNTQVKWSANFLDLLPGEHKQITLYSKVPVNQSSIVVKSLVDSH